MSSKDKQRLEKGALGKMVSEMNNAQFKEFDKEFLAKSMVIIRVYVLRALSLAQMDEDSLSDPYVKIRLGKKVVDVRIHFFNYI